MYRVARKGVLIIEARDSLLMKTMVKLNVAEKYEISAVTHQDEYGDYGGVDNTEIPNYVYRWTEREVNKLLKSLDPSKKNTIIFDYENDLTNIKSKNPLIKIIIFFAKIFFIFFKKQQNCLSIFIDKTKSLNRF